MSIAIKAQEVSKTYLITHQMSPRYLTFSEKLSSVGRQISTKIRHPMSKGADKEEYELFSALDNISFEIKQGDRIGILGRNGAGKSTLLKILSRITEPSSGWIGIKGRIASLLEVGTGFHPELTGRENIFLNGAILGMTKRDIKRKFDEIVDFSEVEKFLDTPVKRYSSGMYVRLAFSVAAHLEPDIFIVDEVLAVGDAQFQKKCIGKMNEVQSGGRTLLFVSHNVSQLQSLCDKGLLLNQGKLESFDRFEHVLSRYSELLTVGVKSFYEAPSSSPIITRVDIFSEKYGSSGHVATGESLEVVITYKSYEKRLNYAAIGINDSHGVRALTSRNYFDEKCIEEFPNGGKIHCKLESLPLKEGIYYLDIAIGQRLVGFLDRANSCLKIEVLFDNYFGNGSKLLPGEGVIVAKAAWTAQP
ncbi:ATP-binding cassette domain-containing protein [Hahella sp. KA22]|uniref:ABC transporter ATP-binding protein n=1 Tax=Hahella sp. KA22 TaxID=1628392 RepID=UPI000FDDC496|nr:ABC transporter ATP-binding protein [Hahella sp. KA22]AZZ90903.1 ABC transporter ATP-binding protein [Hahella sp. KA22]QAY54273.1 ATP-binding cassette domain-containing protein [Hahella sp. KA22]